MYIIKEGELVLFIEKPKPKNPKPKTKRFKGGNTMAVNRFVLNGISYHGHGAINEIPGIVASKGFKKAFVASDPNLVKFGVTARVTDLLEKNGINDRLLRLSVGIEGERDLIDEFERVFALAAMKTGAEKMQK
jgi:hypothetical protein